MLKLPYLYIVLVLIIFNSSHSFAETSSDNLQIAVILIENPGGDAGIESLCEAVTDTIDLTFRLVNKYKVIRLDFLAPEVNIDRSSIYLKNNCFDNAVYGQINLNEEGQYSILVKGWERASDSVVVETKETADSVFSMFDIVDKLTVKFIEEFSGEHIGFGKVHFVNEGVKADYNIYIDGNYLGKNIEESDILYGDRTFKITEPGSLGDTVVETVTLNVEENGDQNVVFSMVKTSPSVTAAAGSAGRSAIGNLFVDAAPEGSEVFMDNQSIGFTPLSLYGVSAGLYDLRIENEYYVPDSQVLRLEPNVDNTFNFDLGIDIENPYIKKQLKNPISTAIIAGGLTTLQMASYLLQPVLFPDSEISSDPHSLSYLHYMLVAPKLGLLLSGNTLTGTIMSTASFIGYLSLSGYFDEMLPESMNNTTRDITAFSLVLGSMLYDLIFTPYAAKKYNNKLISKMKTRGVNFEKDKKKYFITLQTGNKGLLDTGISYAPFWNWLYFEQLIGITNPQYLDITSPKLSLTSKILTYPDFGVDEFVEPYIGALSNYETDFTLNEFCYGAVSGFDINFPWFKVFLEADVCTSNGFNSQELFLETGIRF